MGAMKDEMPQSPDEQTMSVRVAGAISEIEPHVWDALAQDRPGRPLNPFVRHAFLSALEDSGCVGQAAGWLPQHLVLEDGGGRVLGLVPAYLKGHSQGEYVFDHGWADAFERAGGRYYPKLQVSVPFTPATGPRLLVGSGEDAPRHRAILASAIESYVGQTGISSAHATFVGAADLEAFTGDGFLHRTDQQFHFVNRGYARYDDFLDTLASRKRKTLRKERQAALENGITIERLTGSSLTGSVWDAFFTFYMDTGSRKWGRPYLNRRFFSLLGERMGEEVVLVMAKRDGRYVAGALNLVGAQRIYGRYWGCVEDHPFLHFELCYHQAVDYAIEHGLEIVEAGAQGEHKLARGYEPVLTHSAHFIAHPGLRRAVAEHLAREREDVDEVRDALAAHTPFRKDDRPGE